MDALIKIRRDNTDVVIDITGGPLGDTFFFRHQCGNMYYASLLRQHFDNQLFNTIEAIRREEYERGYKDGRAKRGKKTWFSGLLIKIYK